MAPTDPDVLVDLFAPFAPVTIRRMFSGHAIYRAGVVFALSISGEIFLKCDAESAPTFVAEGLTPFVYATRRGETTVGSYRRMPEACFDDEDALRRWANLAWQAGLRADRARPRRPVKPP
ncbi:TfoX/Sxy family protein [Phreatobacter sp.]|uniref:TfoX/Sxy family protein n=1 Tax=Phreatobacter sp. TaxID=1966341 RepID=UPI0025FFE9A8|nr:TfoX/Sxy family protein [Phreatobacter sp.]